MNILSKKLKYCTKEILKYFNIILIALGFISALILIKYKPIYKVSILGEEIGYITEKEAFEESIKENVMLCSNKNIDSIDINVAPIYELKLVDRKQETNEAEVIEKVEENLTITYKYYEIALNNEAVEKVNTLEEAEKLVNTMKEENGETIELTIMEQYTQNEEEVATVEVEVAKSSINEKVVEIQAKKAEEERIAAMPEVNGIKLATLPVNGTITSRYGESSRLRKSTHTGLDIAAPSGTPIKVVADGTVTFAGTSGSYGKLVKVDHGNGVETWYAHASKLYVTEGQKVTAEEVIAAVGTTGNSTGNHLHLEIRVNGEIKNPQNYLYK